VDAVVYSVTTAGLSQRQIENTPLGDVTFRTLIAILAMPLRHFFARVLRRQRIDGLGRPDLR
jgi:hypothetical protein